MATQIHAQMLRLLKQFNEQPVPRKVADGIKSKLDRFKIALPLIRVLRNPGLDDRHWIEISQIVGLNLKLDASSTLIKVLEMNLMVHMVELEKISNVATKQYSLQQQFNQIKLAWNSRPLDCALFRESGAHILAPLDDVEAMLDDQLVSIHSMKLSPFSTCILPVLMEWESNLMSLGLLLEQWLYVQSSWLYLYPIFSSDDLAQQLPIESKKFDTVDKTWRDVMNSCAASNNIMALMLAHPRLFQRLQECNLVLEEIQKGLVDFLEKKRLQFPRFFFLSNEELLEILSETTDPSRVQPFLSKCFEGLSSLVFQESNQYRIIAICSSENERVRLSEVIEPLLSRGAVERWLLLVEKGMFRAVAVGVIFY